MVSPNISEAVFCDIPACERLLGRSTRSAFTFLDLGEPTLVHDNALHHLGGNPEPILLQRIAELLAVDQIYRRGTVTCGLALGVRAECARRDIRPLSVRPTMAPRKSRTAPAPTVP